jgi:hypothetical protein
MEKPIFYRSGYKYQLAAPLQIKTAITGECPVITEYICLDFNGTLSINEGYAWDGPSGPAIDTKTFMRGSLVHDALYQLMREKHLDHEKWRKTADQELARICREDGMWSVRAWWVYLGVRWFADPASEPSNEKQIIQAP